MAKSISKKTISDFTGQHLSELAKFGKTYLFDTVSSTQGIAKGLVSKQEPALVIALAQTRGRGRFNRDWHSDKGGLYFSYLFFPDFSAKHKIYQLTLFTGLTIAQSLEKLIHHKIDIRWPNDLILAGKKIGGILCETKGKGLIIGIGLNLNQTFFPASLLEATSLFIETNKKFENSKVLNNLLTALVNSYQDFALSKFSDLLPEIRKRQILINQRVRVNLWLRRIEGSVIDLDDEGRLLLRTDPGRLITITAGKVHRIANVQ